VEILVPRLVSLLVGLLPAFTVASLPAVAASATIALSCPLQPANLAPVSTAVNP